MYVLRRYYPVIGGDLWDPSYQVFVVFIAARLLDVPDLYEPDCCHKCTTTVVRSSQAIFETGGTEVSSHYQ
jgi:hypothetical protein